MKLLNTTKNTEVAQHVEEKISFVGRLVGLIGRKDLDTQTALWFPESNSIHTCFMAFSIDVVLVNKELVVEKVYEDLKPWKWTWPVWKASSVFEMKAGVARKAQIEVGDRLNVVN